MPEHTNTDENLCEAQWKGDNMSSRAVNSGKDAYKTKQSIAGLQRFAFFPQSLGLGWKQQIFTGF